MKSPIHTPSLVSVFVLSVFFLLLFYQTFFVQAQTCTLKSQGDANCDNAVSLLDFEVWRKEFTKQTTSQNADFNSDGTVNVVDYEILRKNFNNSPNPQTAQNSQSFGIWTPSKWDTCTTADHDSYFVVGPDGKKYPTWHPPVHRRANGSTCTFGHEHGRDPLKYQYWDEIKTHFAYDANASGSIEENELATAGIPFGYVNEQTNTFAHSGGSHTGVIMRHEDHVGHKIEYANGEGDIGDGTDPFDSIMTGGVVVPVKSNTANTKWDPSGIRCYHFHKIHQGVSTPDALTNNIHEIIMHSKCTSTRPEFPASTSILSGLIPFGAPGEFIRFCNEDRTTPVVLGKNDANQHFPGSRSDGDRNIITRDCLEATFLVPDGQFSGFPYEIWSGQLEIEDSNGRTIASNGGAWEVLDAIRYYHPGTTNKTAYMADMCYEVLGNRRSRGEACDSMTNYGTNRGITWDDPRSGFRGVSRGQYINPHTLANNNGSEFWYSDPFGKNAKTTPFTGSVKQQISPVTTRINFAIDPRIILRAHDSGGSTVHAPN